MQAIQTSATQQFTSHQIATVLAEMLSERFTDGGRLGKAADIVQAGQYRPLPRYGQWAFVSADGQQEYLVTEQTCSCPDHQRRGLPCKHITAKVMFGRLIRLTEMAPEAVPLTCPRCHRAPTSVISARAIRNEGECTACISDNFFGDDAA